MTANSPGRLLKNLLLRDGENWRFNVEPQGRAVYPGRRIRSRLLLPGLQRGLPHPAPSLGGRAEPIRILINCRDYAALSTGPPYLLRGIWICTHQEGS